MITINYNVVSKLMRKDGSDLYEFEMIPESEYLDKSDWILVTRSISGIMSRLSYIYSSIHKESPKYVKFNCKDLFPVYVVMNFNTGSIAYDQDLMTEDIVISGALDFIQWAEEYLES